MSSSGVKWLPPHAIAKTAGTTRCQEGSLRSACTGRLDVRVEERRVGDGVAAEGTADEAPVLADEAAATLGSLGETVPMAQQSWPCLDEEIERHPVARRFDD